MDVTWTGWRGGGFARFWRRAADKAAERPAPPPPRRVARPVFIHDAIIPYQGSTLLLSVLRDAEGDPPPDTP